MQDYQFGNPGIEMNREEDEGRSVVKTKGQKID